MLVDDLDVLGEPVEDGAIVVAREEREGSTVWMSPLQPQEQYNS